MKICIYTICKNESLFVERWYNSVKEADYVCVLDTGSEDNTYQKLKALPIITAQKKIEPFRFDIARNESMKLIPEDADLCMVIDLDEYMFPGWRERIEREIDCRKDIFISTYEERVSIFPIYTTRRRFHMNHRNLKWEYQVHEQLIKEGGVFDSTICQKLNFTVQHTPEPSYNKQYSNKNNFYKTLAKQRLEEYKDPLSYWIYSSYIYREDPALAQECIERALQSSDEQIVRRSLKTALIIKLRQGLDCKRELKAFYSYAKANYQDDPQLEYLLGIWQHEPQKALPLVKKLIQNPPYSHKNYILSLYRLLWELEPTFSTYQKIQELL